MIADNVQRKTRVPARIIAATGALIMGVGAILFATRLGTDPHYASDFLPGWLAIGSGQVWPCDDPHQWTTDCHRRTPRQAARSSRCSSRSVPS